MSRTTSRAIWLINSRLTTACDPHVLNRGGWPRPSPAITILFVVVSVSQPNLVLLLLSSPMPSLMSLEISVSRMASEIWSQTLSGCPSDTDSLVNIKVFRDMRTFLSVDPEFPLTSPDLFILTLSSFKVARLQFRSDGHNVSIPCTHSQLCHSPEDQV